MPRTRSGGFCISWALTLTFVGIALLSAKKGHGFFIFYILRTIYDVDHFAPRTNGLTDTHALKLGVSLD
jgi:hypothetical protein